MKTCPVCNGDGGWFQYETYYFECNKKKWIDCHECGGRGKVSRLKIAVFKARGNCSASVKLRRR